MTIPSRKYHVLGIGNAIVDVIAKCDENALTQNKLVKGTMALADEVTANHLYAQMPAALESSGGSSANSAAIAASLGSKTAFIGKVANDQLGKIFEHDIKSTGVAFSTPPLTDGAGTARCLIFVTPDAERTMSTYLGACAELSKDDLDTDMIENTALILLEGYLFDKPAAQEAFYAAARIAKAAGNKVALTLSDAACVRRHHAAFTDFVEKNVNVLFANEKEIKAFCQTDDFDTAVQKIKGKCDIAVLTRGGDGALIVTPTETIAIPPATIEKLVDTTGAGDAFAGGFLHSLAHNKSLIECGHTAAFSAGQIISQVGARPLRPLADVLKDAKTPPAPKPKHPEF